MWVCEKHPWLEWPDGECPGPGMPLGAMKGVLRARLLLQEAQFDSAILAGEVPSLAFGRAVAVAWGGIR